MALTEHQKEYKKQYRLKNKEKLNKRERELYLLNHKHNLERDSLWRKNNPDKVKSAKARYRADGRANAVDAYSYFMKNGETIDNYRKRYYLNNKDRVNAQKKEYYEKNKDWLNVKKNNYYRLNKDRVSYVKSIINDSNRFGGNKQVVLIRDNYECQECGLNNEQHIVIYGVGLHIHHKDSNNKNHDLNNLQTLCMRCHRKTFHIDYNKRGALNK